MLRQQRCTLVMLLVFSALAKLQCASAGDQVGGINVENAILKTIDAVRLAAEVSGKIAELKVSPGDRVREGQEIGRIRDSALKLQLEKAKVSMAIARKKARSDVDIKLSRLRAEVARNELTRAEASNARLPGTYSTKEIDRLQLVASSAELEVEKAKHDKEVAELDVMMAENDFKQVEDLLSRHQIVSSADGVVVSVEHRAGEWVEPGTELLQIVRINRLRIEGFIDQSKLGKELVDRSATVTVIRSEDDERQVEGKVVFVSPDTNPINGKIRIHLEIDNKENLFRPGMRVLAKID